ncbi:hypothetical protein OBBRIDRAFT_732687 [Obba rivulosa]|uniref:Uncharacterized protein n=1 Tax=Obba rivulosa TaxID=1052685 RepID=A0A8E2AR43_9APHY|nr:hypothetical protein OBBRIDRAFT_732687 [Obba rivulosa]
MSRKPWSKSADDLGKLSQTSSPTLTPIDTSFRDRVADYRSNRNDSVGSTNTPSTTSPAGSMSVQKSFPFPTINPPDSLSSSPPQRSGPLSSTPSPVNGNAQNLAPTQSSGGHVHARSHSFTPRIAKLTAPKVSLLPPSPSRKGSASSERDVGFEREHSKSPSGGSSGSGPSSTRSAFPFSLGGSGAGGGKGIPLLNTAGLSNSGSAAPSPVSLKPPVIIEPQGAGSDSKLQKRASQVVYHSGFINRMTDFNPSVMNARATHFYMSGSGSLALVKGWKPFKLVLKGSKLYFYKPPGDRSAAIKELFPTGLVPVLEDEVIAELTAESKESDLEGSKGKERDETRRRRAYWGRGTHPSLVVTEDCIERGTFEALVHEAVFATTFLATPEHSSESKQDEQAEQRLSLYKPQWQDFSTAVLLSVPLLVDRAAFEAEFLRCCSYLVSGANDDAREEERTRITWLISQYLNYHNVPLNKTAWEDWRKETLPNFPSDIEAGSRLAGLPKTVSTQALYTPSPNPNNPTTLDNLQTSPSLGMFSPRPGVNDKMMSIVEALGEPTTAPNAPPFDPRSLAMALEQEGLSRNVLLGTDPQLLARSLYVLNKRLLHNVPDNFSVDLFYAPAASEAEPTGPNSAAPDPSASAKMAPFVGSDAQPHWLTKLILTEILAPEVSGSGALHVDAKGHGSRVYSRFEVISAWARVGELCRRTGDECSWRAILAALCSRPIARLDKAWKRVDAEALAIVQSWVEPLARGECLLAAEPRIIPWAGDLKVHINELAQRARVDDTNEWDVTALAQFRDYFEGLRTSFALCTRTANSDALPEPEDVEALVQQWKSAYDTDLCGTSKCTRIDQFMSLSLAAEPRRKGLFEPYFWTRHASHQSFHPLTPLLFPEPLPTVTFLNRALIARSRLDSNASVLNMQDVQHIRDMRSRADGVTAARTSTSKNRGLDLGGTVLSVHNGELLLLVQPGSEATGPSQPSSRAPSRPPSSVADLPSVDRTFSRTPSIRISPGSSRGLERKPSMIRRNSLPSISQRTSLLIPEAPAEKPIRVIVQAGTLDRLVDVLVHGVQGVSVSVSDDNGETPLQDAKTREVQVDMDDFSRVWWNVFRSFVTPQVLFEFLRKRYSGARLNPSSSAADVSHIVRVRSEILETINEWVTRGGGAQDALDDPQLFTSFESFLNNAPEHSLSSGEHHFGEAEQTLATILKVVRQSFAARTMRPSTSLSTTQGQQASGGNSQTFGLDPPDIDRLDAEGLVNNLNAMAAATFRNVSAEDLFITADVLEVQSADRTGWFAAREPSSFSDEVEIQNMCAYIAEVEPSSMISELTQDSVYRLLPPTTRSCIRAFGLLRKWTIAQLTAFDIGLRARQARMELVIRAIEICRLRTDQSSETDLPLAERSCVRSFVEAVLTSAILSLESRIYHRAWLTVAHSRGSTCDSVAALLNKPTTSSVNSRGPLVVDIGWILERLLEIISTPDVLDSASQDSLSLVNFEKRRSIHTLVVGNSGSAIRTNQFRHDLDRHDLERLDTIEKTLSKVHFDLRAIREEAYREVAASVPSSPVPRRGFRPFQALVSAQQEKNKRDRTMRERLSREKRQEQQRHERREDYLNKAMNMRRPPSAAQKQHRNKKSVSSAFFQLMRPISSAFSSDSLSSPGVKRSAAELDFTPSQKPSLVLSVVNARVAEFVNNERSFTLQLDTEDGGHYLLQAPGRPDLKKWMETIERVSKTTAKRRLTYLGQTANLQGSMDPLQPSASSQDPRAVFGVELEVLLQRETADSEAPVGAIPSVVQRLITEVEKRGLTEVGIYRLAGAHSEVNACREALNRGREWPIDESTDINVACDLIKSWFRVLPGGLFPENLYKDILDAACAPLDDTNLDTRLGNIRQVIHSLPAPNFSVLRRLIEHLDKVTDFEENNQMTAESLATVFSPNILRSPNNDIGTFFANMSSGHRVTKLLISHFHTIFDSEDDADQDAEDGANNEGPPYEYDSPILEEDEEDLDSLEIAESEDDAPRIPAEPPTLDISIPSPHSLSFPMPA